MKIKSPSFPFSHTLSLSVWGSEECYEKLFDCLENKGKIPLTVAKVFLVSIIVFVIWLEYQTIWGSDSLGNLIIGLVRSLPLYLLILLACAIFISNQSDLYDNVRWSFIELTQHKTVQWNTLVDYNFLFILWLLGIIFRIRTPPTTTYMYQDSRASMYYLEKVWHEHGQDNGLFKQPLGLVKVSNVVPSNIGIFLHNVPLQEINLQRKSQPV